jgi:hypothetical protein
MSLKPVSGSRDERMLLYALCPFQIGYDICALWACVWNETATGSDIESYGTMLPALIGI